MGQMFPIAKDVERFIPRNVNGKTHGLSLTMECTKGLTIILPQRRYVGITTFP